MPKAETKKEEATTDVTATVYNKHRRIMRVFTGKTAKKEAEALASQERRDGWTVEVR